MAGRPNFIDLRSASSTSVDTTGSRPLKSPRLHVAGEIPPTLSPLDAFAAQSRLLAKQLEESQKAGKRLSRLPPLTTESPLVIQARSEYFRSMSYDEGDETIESPLQNTGLGLTTEIETPIDRPVSMHPRMSRIPPTPDQSVPLPPNPFLEANRGRHLEQVNEDPSTWGARREQSPGSINSKADSAQERISLDRDRNLQEPSVHAIGMAQSPEKLTRQISHDSSLAPPRSLFPKRSSSIMSVPLEPSDEEKLSASFHSQPPRKASTSSFSLASPPIGHYQRSPSISSEVSMGLPRPSFNFSRPLSRAGTPSFDTPSRQASQDSQPSFILADETAHTPVSMHSDGFTDSSIDDPSKAAPSYIYSKYSLPRGKTMQRNSQMMDGEAVASYSWEQPMVPPSNVTTMPLGGQAPPSPPTRPSSSSSRYLDGPTPTADGLAVRPSMERSKLSYEVSASAAGEPSPDPSRPSTSEPRQSEDAPRGRALTSPLHDQIRGRTPHSVATSDSASTIRPPPKTSHSTFSHAPTTAEMTPEEHLAKGIKCHESGSVNESTYHLRHAARGGNPTGMLLYALACRHGWGMRPNQREGVEWLRKAAEGASLEIADDEEQVKDGKAVDFTERKTRKAQFALSIYELGVSHMNGWGIEQDKALALRCFEIAGTWGDVDALAEAGFCYAQGVGCKKDLKKSAKFYRMAEAKGMSMPGNSWIHKPKYADDADTKSSKKDKARSKSRSRGIFSKRS